MMTINGYLRCNGGYSRRLANRLVAQQRVLIDGRTAVPNESVSGEEAILVDGRVLRGSERIVIMYNKPPGVDCNMRMTDPDSIVHALGFWSPASRHYKPQLFPIGRLDKDSQGLLLLTNDGLLAQRLMHPSSKKVKHYVVGLDASVDANFARDVCRGVDVGGVRLRARSCHVLHPQVVHIELTEGKNRQIRKICRALSRRVIRLERTAIGQLPLGCLPPGQTRTLSPGDILLLTARPG